MFADISVAKWEKAKRIPSMKLLKYRTIRSSRVKDVGRPKNCVLRSQKRRKKNDHNRPQSSNDMFIRLFLIRGAIYTNYG
jgi:hypothetical protein